MKQILKQEWFSNVRTDILAGIVVALALIPEVIGFSIIAGVNPMIGLYASFCIAIVIAFVGGRPRQRGQLSVRRISSFLHHFTINYNNR